MKVDEYITRLRKNYNIVVSVQDDELKIRGQQIDLTPDVISELKAKKTEIVAFFKASRSETTLPMVSSAEKKEYFKLTSAQMRLYFLYEVDKSSLAYNLPQLVELHGELDVNKLNRVFTMLVERHESLRTSFRIVNATVFQHIADALEFKVQQFQATEDQVAKIVDGFIRPFDLATCPLLRVGVISMSDSSHVLMVDMHHIISDGVSQGILIREFMALYNNETLPALHRQYKDFSEWMHTSLNQEKIFRQKKFWLAQYADEIRPLELPTDFIRPAVKSYIGNSLNFEIIPEDSTRLKVIAEQQEATVFMVILALFNILLAKLSNQDDVVIGIPIAGRSHNEFDNVIGMFVHTLALRNSPKDDLDFISFLDELKAKTLLSFDNQSYPYEELVNELRLERTASRNPLFEVMFAFQNFDEPALSIPGLTLRSYGSGHSSSKFDITLKGYEQDGRIRLTFEYATSLFRSSTIDRFSKIFLKIVSLVAVNPYIKIGDIDITTQQEKDLILNVFNNTTTPYPDQETIVSLFERQAKRTPSAIAVTFDGSHMTYGELNELSYKIAAYLQCSGNICQNDLVGIMLEREAWLIPTIFGILRSGAAYVPIDPNYPSDRIDSILEDSGMKALITRGKYLSAFFQKTTEILDLDLISDSINDHDISCQLSPILSNQLAYVIYTSGSTGKPKGVMIEHHSVVNRITWMQKEFPINESDILLQKTPITFDVSVWELFWWAFQGASLVILKPGEEKEPRKIVQYIDRMKVTTIHFVPSMLSAFLFDLETDRLQSQLRTLRYVFCSGEALKPDHVNLFGETVHKHCSTRLINLYGPTEATVDVSFYECSFHERCTGVPIGIPIDNIRLYVINNRSDLSPIGVAGELCIAGVGLARGYLGNEKLTAEKFVCSLPFTQERVYKTGDIARWSSDGKIEYIGRLDSQVKLKGLRIELGEIENQLLSYAPITDTTVLVKGSEENKYLVAYYAASHEINASDLREYLLNKLPEYMVPWHFIHLAKIPVTPNGKTDRRSLPDVQFSASQEYLLPRTKEEKILADVWSKVLDVKSIGPADNFFLLGGDSIKSIQISSRMRSHGYELSVRDIFTYPTIERLAPRLKPLEMLADQSVVVGKSLVTPIQRWFFEGAIANKSHFNHSVMLNFEEEVSSEAIVKIFEEICRHHDALRTTFLHDEGKFVQQTNDVVPVVSLQEFDYKNEEHVGIKIQSAADSLQSSLSLETGQLLKLALFHLTTSSRLLIVIHHLVVDGISWRILFEDIEILHNQLKSGERLSLPLKTDSYLSWSTYLQKYTSTIRFEEGKRYWKALLHKLPPPVRVDHPSGTNKLSKHLTETFSLTTEWTDKLLGEVHIPFNTKIDDILLTALVFAMHDQYGCSDVLVDLEGHGREEIAGGINISRTVGWFTCIYPVLLQISGSDMGRCIRSIKEMLHQAAHHGIDYLLTEQTNQDDAANILDDAMKKRQIIFNYLGQFDVDAKGRSYTIVDEPRGHEIDPGETMSYDWYVSGMIFDGRLQMRVSYSGERFEVETMRTFMHRYKERLLSVIEYCCAFEKVLLTPSDVSYKQIGMAQLEALQLQHDVQNIYPLSPMQEGILFHSVMEKNSSAYCDQTVYQVRGDLSVTTLEKSMSYLINRNDILRTIFLYEGCDRGLQVVLKKGEIAFEFKDIREECLKESPENIILHYHAEDRLKPFDLKKGPLMRITVLQTGDNRYEFIWNHHHILMDGWGVGIIVNEFTSIYNALGAGREVMLPPVTPYSYYIEWLERRDKTEAERYWRTYLESYDTLATLPLNGKVHAESLPYVQKLIRCIFDLEQTRMLRQSSRQHGVTLNTLFQCAWAVLLARYNNTEDVVFGSVVSGRPTEIPGIETMVGLFINTVPVRVTFAGDDTIASLLKRVQAEALESEEHHYHPLSEVQALSELGGGLLDHIIAFENFPIQSRIENSQLRTTDDGKALDVKTSSNFVQTNYDFNVTVLPNELLEVRFDFNASKYDELALGAVIKQLKNIIVFMAENTDRSIREISLADENELTAIRKRLTEDLHKNIDVTSVQKRLAASFKKHWHETAIEYRGQTFTYSMVDQRSDRIGGALRSKGVQQGSNVGIFMDDRQWLICSVLGILKSRAAFVPLETSIPSPRLSAMVQQANCRCIITDQRQEICDRLVTSQPIAWIRVDALDDQYVNEFVETLEYSLEDNVYVYFTSGSTGTPKGVIGSNKGLSHFIGWEIDRFKIDSSFRLSQFTNPGFDVFMRDTLVPLCAGATICIPDEQVMSSAPRIAQWIDQQRIDLIHCVPSFFKLITKDALDKFSFPSLKYILLAGEKILPYELRAWYKAHGNRIQLVNIYGPTETTLAKGCYFIQEQDCWGARIPICPIPGAQFLILDRYLNICPLGVVGEIYIRTPFRSAGYLDSIQTANSFMVNPFGNDASDLLYKTGDLAHRLDESRFEIIGRLDHQVKIRGIRIELDDIRMNMLKYPGISDVAVVVNEGADGEALLCAYIVSNGAVDTTSLRKYLDKNLPAHMVPSYLATIAELPLLQNGKLNRKALPLPRTLEIMNDHVPPVTLLEKRLAAIWSEVLSVETETISCIKTFFELGGHSLKVFYLINRLQQEFNVKLKLGDIFQFNTVKKQAELVAGLTEMNKTRIGKTPLTGYHVTSPSQKRIFYQYLLDTESISYNIPIAIKINGDADLDRINRIFQLLIDRHEALRTSFILNETGVMQIVNEQVTVNLELFDGERFTLNEIIDEFVRPFDLSSQSLFRYGLVQKGAFDLLLVDIHHIVADGVSLDILVRDFKRLYLEKDLPQLELSYVDYAYWIDNVQQNFEHQREFWAAKLSGKLPRMGLSVGQKRKKTNTYVVSTKTLSLEGHLYRQLKQFTASANVSDFMFLLSVQYILLSRLSGCPDVIIGTDVVGRTEPMLQNIVGTFVNVLPLRIQVNAEDSFIEFLERVKQCVLEAFEHQDFQFDQMVSMVNGGEDLLENPVVDVHFSFTNTIDDREKLDLFEFYPLPNKRDEIAQYELQLEATEWLDRIDVQFIYSRELYDNETMDTLITYYLNILKFVLYNAASPVGIIDMEVELETAS